MNAAFLKCMIQNNALCITFCTGSGKMAYIITRKILIIKVIRSCETIEKSVKRRTGEIRMKNRNSSKMCHKNVRISD